MAHMLAHYWLGDIFKYIFYIYIFYMRIYLYLFKCNFFLYTSSLFVSSPSCDFIIFFFDFFFH